MFQPWAWLFWLSSAVIALSATRNPFYLTLTWVCVLLVNHTLRRQAQPSPWQINPLRFAIFIIPLSALFNAAISHIGETILLTIPPKIPYLGGPVTLEALAYGLINGLILTGLISAFIVFHQGITIRSLIRLIPRAFFSLAIVTSIAITFLPAMKRQLQQIQEAQAIRGHRLKGLRDWLPLLIPMISGGIEKAFQLAEAMTARGFASGSSRGTPLAAQAGLIGGTLLLVTGWLLDLAGKSPLVNITFMVAGALSILFALRTLGQLSPHTPFRKEPWRPNDGLMILCSTITIVSYAINPSSLVRASLAYQPYPLLTLPSFNVYLGITTLALLSPIFLKKNISHDRI